MLRLALVLGCALALAACGDDDGDGAGEPPAREPAADLTVTVWPEGAGGPKRERKVECAELGSGSRACRELSLAKLAPVPRDTACTAVYGGPDEAHVVGTIDGERVDERFSRQDGCQIARWDENVALLGRPSNRRG